MRFRSLALVPFLAASALAMHCGGTTVGQNVSPEGGPPIEGGVPGEDAGTTNPDAVGATTASKVDLLLVVDNSASMGDKAKLLASSLTPLLKAVAASGDVATAGVASAGFASGFLSASFLASALSSGS